MNRKRIIILISAVVLILMILWYDLPIQFPWAVNIMMLYLKISVVVILAFIAFFFAGRKKNQRNRRNRLMEKVENRPERRQAADEATD